MTFPQRSGVLAAGNFIVDHTKVVESYPAEGNLAQIVSEFTGNGGGPYNVLKDLAKLGAAFPLEAVGLVGQDGDGDGILRDLQQHGINASRLMRCEGVSTSYTEVITALSSKQRTFFHQRGANALLDVEHFDFSITTARFFYLGYLLLLDRLDQPCTDHGTRAGRVLAEAGQAGLFTITDCVSLEGGAFAEIFLPALPHIDGCILNDFEAEQATGITLRKNGVLLQQALQAACAKLFSHGLRCWAVIHFPEGAFAMKADGESFAVAGFDVPEIAGTSGAGDAFAAGLIFSLHEGGDLKEALEWGCAVAAVSLRHPSTSDGIHPLGETLAITRRFARKKAI